MTYESSSADGTLLVPVANAETAQRQLDTAVDLARDWSYRIRLLFVLSVPSQLSLMDARRYLLEEEDERMLEDAAQAIEDRGVPADGRIRLARGVATGIVGAADEYDVDAIFMGWRGRPPRQGVVLGSYLDRVLRDAECDVLVERIRTRRPDVDRILVPVGGGPHAEFAAGAAASIARQQDASVTLLHVHSPEDPDFDRSEAEDRLAESGAAFDGVQSVDRTLVEDDDVAGTITDWTATHDVTVLGVSGGGLVQRKLLGSISEGVGRNAAGSVILARRYDPVPSRLRRLLP